MLARDGAPQHPDIDRRPDPCEIDAGFAAARRAGLWRFDERCRSAVG